MSTENVLPFNNEARGVPATPGDKTPDAKTPTAKSVPAPMSPEFAAAALQRTIFISGGITMEMADRVIKALKVLGTQLAGESAEQKAALPITLMINSPGGSVDAGMAIYDAMMDVQARFGIPVATVGTGMDMSMGSFLLSAGTKGYRTLTPNADAMNHQPSGGAQGTASEIENTNQYMQETKARMRVLYLAHGLKPELFDKYYDNKDNYLRAEEAVEAGLVDKVIYPHELARQGLASGVSYAPGVLDHVKKVGEAEKAFNIHVQQIRKAANDDSVNPFNPPLPATGTDGGAPVKKPHIKLPSAPPAKPV